VYEINAGLGGEYSLIVQPSIEWNAELRLDGAYGQTIGYVAKGQYNTTFKMDAGLYNVFPVIRQYNRFRNEIVTFYPKYDDGRAKLVSAGLSASDPEIPIDIGEVLQGTTLSTGGAFIIVDNQASTAVQLFNANTVQLTSTGINFVNAGKTNMFQVNMAKLSDNKYAEKQSISTYTLGSVSLHPKIGDVELEVDKIYRVTIKGSNAAFTVSEPVFEATMSLSDSDQ
jgi:hypothetical protein